jgi:gluconate 2-dehydrogenase gamma chain
MADGPMPNGALDRRALMRSAILLVGGVVAGLPDIAFATAPTTVFFAPAERAVLDTVCAALIPRTDTPGALEAGVPAFIDAMMTNWAAPETAGGFRAVLAKIDGEARAATGKGFASLPPEQRDARLQAFDAAAFAANDRAWRGFRNLALTGYYLSEAGATQELRYELSPGVWEPGIKVGPDTRAWAV